MADRPVKVDKRVVGILLLTVSFLGGGLAQAAAPDNPGSARTEPKRLLVAENAASPAGEQANRIEMRPYLAHRISKTHALLAEQAPLIQDELDSLKTTGYLDRRAKIAIESNVAKALDTMEELHGMQQAGAIDPVRTNAITYDLGMAGDALARWASELGESGALEEKNAESAEQWSMSNSLQETSRRLERLSDMLWETANAVVRNLADR